MPARTQVQALHNEQRKSMFGKRCNWVPDMKYWGEWRPKYEKMATIRLQEVFPRLMQWFGTNESMAIFGAGVNKDPVSIQVSSTGRNFDKFNIPS